MSIWLLVRIFLRSMAFLYSICIMSDIFKLDMMTIPANNLIWHAVATEIEEKKQ